MKCEYFQAIQKMLWLLENDDSLSYGDFQQKAELIKRGLDFLVEAKGRIEGIEN